jgi:DNA-binding response OmpR family regulator
MPPNTILVVDDEPVIAHTIVLILNRHRDEFLAVGSTDVSEALTIVRDTQPDLVLLDAIMPGTRGLQHAIDMRQKYDCNVVIMSGQPGASDLLEKLDREGHVPFEIIPKPIHPDKLVAKIRELLRRPSPLV